ncbi:MAG TPA: RpiB/LacA/LacB family sugar-phosphate isomerase [Candidatus Paceibacterota bacterium]|jgi:ribose 5-phosphate isomerase B|nr:RpiB/LacA/LacB family sugar-phosphate isomerase [Candidatus Paceibacterota bacterium]
MIYLGADHAGFKYKEKIKEFLTASDLKFEDLGNLQLDPQDDFPVFAFRVAERVAKDLAEGDQSARGILICTNGLGMSIAANKIKGIRAVLITSKKTAQQSREHLDSNILCLGANTISFSLAKKIIRTWLSTDFLPKERYIRRLKEITDKENAGDSNN